MTSATLAGLREAMDAIRRELAHVVVGQQNVIDHLMLAILAGEHCLLEAAPGSAKNRLVASLAQILGLGFHRVHCTPELGPVELLSRAEMATDERSGSHQGPATLPHVLLVDDITRLVPAAGVVVQQAIAGGGIQLDGTRWAIPQPFIVLATKYRQDEEPADVADEPRDDRYMLKIAVRFPSYHDEFRVADAPTAGEPTQLKPILDAARVVQFQQAARGVVAPPHVVHYALRLVRSTRVHEGQTPDFAYEWIGSGAGPRASHHLLTAAKMNAALAGRPTAESADVRDVIHGVLRHRLVTNQNARSNGITPDRVIDRLVYEIPARIDGDDAQAVPGETPKFDVTSDEQWLEE